MAFCGWTTGWTTYVRKETFETVGLMSIFTTNFSRVSVEMQGCGDIIQNEKGKCGNYYGTRARKVLYWSSFIFLLVWSTGAVSGDGIPRIFTNIAPPS